MHHRALVFCPCSEAIKIGDVHPEQLKELPPTIHNINTLHQLPYLNFCETCQAVKCRKCTELEIVTKYCPKCMNIMKPEYQFCSKNCFDCPLCSSHVTIHQKSSSKSYKMRCVSCEWHYEIEELNKPRALSKVIKSMVNKDDRIQFFDELERYYLQRKQLQQGMEIPRDLYIQFNELKIKKGLKDSQLDDFIRSNTIKPLSLSDDELLRQSRSQLRNTNVLTLPLEQSLEQRISTFDKTKVHPVSTRLRTKCSKRCKACRITLMKPDPDPTSTKFYKLSNAVDFLPTIQIHNGGNGPRETDLKYLIAIKNPLSIPMDVSLSTYTTLPGSYPHKVNLPVSHVKLGAKPENASKLETLIKLIPTIELTKNTKISRVELMNRPQPSEDDESIHEQAYNFAVIPLKIALQVTEEHDLRIPLFLTVKSENGSFGYWSVLDLGVVSVDANLRHYNA